MEEELLKHLTNLLRHSNEIEFHIPTLFFEENFNGLDKQKTEIKDAWDYILNDDKLIAIKVKEVKYKKIKIAVKVKQE